MPVLCGTHGGVLLARPICGSTLFLATMAFYFALNAIVILSAAKDLIATRSFAALRMTMHF